MIKGIITGDIVDSSLIPNEWKAMINEILQRVITDLKQESEASLEMFRGDSFQMMIEKPSEALTFAVAVRAALRAATPDGLSPWDVRLSIGIGEVSFVNNSILTSDGEAFRLSGREFDALGKRRMAVVTPFESLNAELKLSTAFADDIITKWTSKQAEVVYAGLTDESSQKDLAESLGMKLANYNKHWNLARGALVISYINRFKDLITHTYSMQL